MNKFLIQNLQQKSVAITGLYNQTGLFNSISLTTSLYHTIETFKSKVILGLLGLGSASKKCIICEHIGFAETEFQAHLNLLGVKGYAANTHGAALKSLYKKSDGSGTLTQTNNYCLTAMLPTKEAGDAIANYDSGDSLANAKPEHIDTIGGGSNGYSYCVAQFFVYYAQDMGK